MKLLPKIKEAAKKYRLTFIILLIFIVVIVSCCAFVFIRNYCAAFCIGDVDNIFGSDFIIDFRYFEIGLLSFIVAIILKIILKKRLKLWILLITAIFMPILCHKINYTGFQKNHIFYPLVDKGGAFHFLIDRSEMNSLYYYNLFEEQTRQSDFSKNFRNDTIIKHIRADYTTVGLADVYCKYEFKEPLIKFGLSKDNEYKNVKLTISLEEKRYLDITSFYMFDDSGKLHTIAHRHDELGNIIIEFDNEACAKIQNSSPITIYYNTEIIDYNN